MPVKHKGRWQGDGRKFGEGRRLFDSYEEALRFEKGIPQDAVTVEAQFKAGLDLYFRGTPNERVAVSHTDELIRFLGPQTDVSTITTRTVRAYIGYCKGKGNADATVNRKLMTLRKYLKYLVSEKMLAEMPVVETKRETAGRIRYLTEAEEDAIFQHLSPTNRALCTFLLYTGCRLGEALRLKWTDVSDRTVTFWVTKNGHPRSVPLLPEAKRALDQMRGQVQPFKVRYEMLRYDWHRAKALAGLDDPEIVIHTLRHTCASRLVINGADIRRVKDWMGHLDLSTTMRYAHLAPDSLFDIANCLTRDGNALATVDNAMAIGVKGTANRGGQPLGVIDGGMSRVAKGADCKSAGVRR
jgi:site-specific recombinase XerD